MQTSPAPLDAAALLSRIDAHFQAMPPVAALGVRVSGFNGETLRLAAPLAANVNDKGCAFAGLDADVYVADSSIRYRAPVFTDLEVAAVRDAEVGVDWPGFIAMLRSRGRARIGIRADCTLADGTVATESTARFVAIARSA